MGVGEEDTSVRVAIQWTTLCCEDGLLSDEWMWLSSRKMYVVEW